METGKSDYQDRLSWKAGLLRRQSARTKVADRVVEKDLIAIAAGTLAVVVEDRAVIRIETEEIRICSFKSVTNDPE
jgi:hypothetical protein